MSTTTKQIGSLSFTIGQLPAWEAFGAWLRFVKLAGPSLAPLVRAASAEKTERATGELLAALPQLLMTAPVEDVLALARDVLKHVSVVGADKRTAPVLDVFDSLMQGKLFAIHELLWACIKENFGGFFEELAARLRSLKPSSGEPSPKVAQSGFASPSS